MEVTASDWKTEMERALAAFHRETIFSLGNIKAALKRKGLPFNAKFREFFLVRSTERIKHAYDVFEMDSMLEDEVNLTRANGNIADPGLVMMQRKATTQMNQTYIKSEAPLNATNEQDSVSMDDTTGQPTDVVQVINDVTIVTSVQELAAAANQSGPINQVDRWNLQSDKTIDSIHVKAKEDIQQKVIPEKEDVVPLVLVTLDPKLIDPKRCLADVVMNNNKSRGGTSHASNVIQIDDSDDEENETEVPETEADKSNKERQSDSIDVSHRSTGRKSIGGLLQLGATKMNSKASILKKSKPEKRFRCTVCGCVGHHSSLSRHMRTHTGEKPYGCHRCGKRFIQSNNLKKHTVTHTDIFPFHCKGCFSGFLQKAEKEAHDKVCSNRRYECHLCKKFENCRKSDLIRHMRKHTGEKPFRCEICMRHFQQKVMLKSHLDTIHTRINS